MSMSAQDKNRIFGRIGLTIGLVAFIAGGVIVPVGVLVSKLGVPKFIGAVLLLAAIAGVVRVFWKIFNDPAMTGRPENEDLLENGVPGIARVLEKTDTGWTVNTQPKVELQLEIQLALPDCPAYKTKIKTLIPRLQPDLYNPGTVLEVRVDPKNFVKRIAIVGAASGGQEEQLRPEKTRKKSNSRKGRRSTHKQQQEDQT